MNKDNKKRPTLGRAEPASAGAQRQDAGETRGQANGAGRGAKKRLTASERESLIRLGVAMEILIAEGHGHLAERSKLVPWARRDLAMMAAKCCKLLAGFKGTIPQDQMMTYIRTMQSVGYRTGMKAPGAQENDYKNFGLWLPFEVMNALLEGLHDHCMMCNLDVVGRKQCRLRKALHTIPNDSEERSDGDCPYFGLM